MANKSGLARGLLSSYEMFCDYTSLDFVFGIATDLGWDRYINQNGWLMFCKWICKADIIGRPHFGFNLVLCTFSPQLLVLSHIFALHVFPKQTHLRCTKTTVRIIHQLTIMRLPPEILDQVWPSTSQPDNRPNSLFATDRSGCRRPKIRR